MEQTIFEEYKNISGYMIYFLVVLALMLKIVMGKEKFYKVKMFLIFLHFIKSKCLLYSLMTETQSKEQCEESKMLKVLQKLFKLNWLHGQERERTEMSEIVQLKKHQDLVGICQTGGFILNLKIVFHF